MAPDELHVRIGACEVTDQRIDLAVRAEHREDRQGAGLEVALPGRNHPGERVVEHQALHVLLRSRGEALAGHRTRSKAQMANA
jgi:hypothetical protein